MMYTFHTKIEMVAIWRNIATAIRKEYTNHQHRDGKMRVLRHIIATSDARQYDAEIITLSEQLIEVLDFLTREQMTHSEVREGLWLFDLLCETATDEWQKGDEKRTQEAVVAPDDVGGGLPF